MYHMPLYDDDGYAGLRLPQKNIDQEDPMRKSVDNLE